MPISVVWDGQPYRPGHLAVVCYRHQRRSNPGPQAAARERSRVRAVDNNRTPQASIESTSPPLSAGAGREQVSGAGVYDHVFPAAAAKGDHLIV